MIRPMDIAIGAALGFIAGAIFHRTFGTAWRWGSGLLGPPRPSELHPRPRDVPPRPAARNILASLASAAAVGVVWLALTLPFRPLVTVWRQFIIAWITTFLITAVIISLRGRRDAA
jgi:hypothetical protein